MPKLARLVVGLVLVLMAMYFAWQKAQEKPRVQPPPVVNAPVSPPTAPGEVPLPENQAPRVRVETERRIKSEIKNAKIRNQDGRVVFQGTIDLRDTLNRIERGQRGSHGNDGTVFQNREQRLPVKPAGHYHEWVHPTPNLSGPGPQRIVTGKDGEIYYTPDHYGTFERLDVKQGSGSK